MPAKPIGDLKSMVGTTARTVEGLQIEPGKVEEFARSITDDDLLYRDRRVARDRGFADVPAPPTFTRTADFPRHRPEGFLAPFGFDLGFDIESALHGEQAYDYHRHPVVGDVLSATATLRDVYQREGRRGGTLTFAVLEEEYVDERGDPVMTCRSTQIETDRTPERASADGSGHRDAPPRDGTPRHGDGPPGQGDSGPTITVGPLERRDFVRYAGASGDFVRVHYDEPFARAAGYESVFAQGMLIAGIASRFVTDWVGLATLERFRTRFEGQVWPDETVAVGGSVAEHRSESDEGSVAVEFRATTGDDRVVLTGDAIAAVDTSE